LEISYHPTGKRFLESRQPMNQATGTHCQSC
jgi:hypothetical protein